MSKFILFGLCLIQFQVFADCKDAGSLCKKNCDGNITVYSKELSYQTDFQPLCEKACEVGESACLYAQGDTKDKCDDFQKRCAFRCPTSVYVHSNTFGVPRGPAYFTDANKVCTSACDQGHGACR